MERELRQMFEIKGAEMSVSPTLSHQLRNRIGRQRMFMGGLVAAAAVAVVLGGFAGARSLSRDEALPPAEPDLKEKSAFLGTWASTDIDGSTQTMVIQASGDGGYEIVVHDDSAGVCSGAPSTMTGTGRLDGASALVIPSPVLTCDDGSEPKVESGPLVEDLLRDLTLVHDPQTDTLTDSLEVVWDRGATAGSSGGMWPQSSLEEVEEAQERADAGDPRFTWQVWPDVFPRVPGQMDPRAVEFFTRFLQEEFGWEEFNWGVAPGLYAGVSNDWPWEFVVVRCAPDQTNPLYPDDPEGRGCAPTLDDNRYETVKVNADQPLTYWEAPDGPSGIWVVTRWAMLGPADAPTTDTHDFFRRQVQQVVPPSDAEATALLEDFLQARVDGDGAEEYLHSPADVQIPLLYATTSDTPYERSDFELVQGPVWPGGWMEFKVRLFTEDGTVVEQPFLVESAEDGHLGLEYGTLEDEEFPTTENGEPLLEPYSILDGEVTFGAPPPWYAFFDYGPETIGLDSGDNYNADFAVLADPLPVETGCRQGPAPTDAEALARSIRSDADFEATEPAAAGIGGIEALRMDVVGAPGASVCDDMGTPLVVSGPQSRGPSLEPGQRMRLYLLDLPAESSAQILAIAFVASEASFETGLEEKAARILDSFEFHAP